MVSDYAMGGWPEHTSGRKLLKEADAKSIRILKEHEEELKSLRNKLVEAGTINKDEIKDFLEGKK